MTTAYDHAFEFIISILPMDEISCIEYINKYNDFYEIDVGCWPPLMVL
ncbi:MAG: hypothetical protein Faunusvirus2_37 [Faunusvirus sp.]|jgi:hypothetical protein|uniref:Uncharacterized protein n=1 Tax=Faunusvirus sp. TaxID=2487766 RepID=A0A3G4ZW67_9VIRU|nr:MAG: hypothetical protein Faunusvirus2_37 [Faunusvirus sp.]